MSRERLLAEVDLFADLKPQHLQRIAAICREEVRQAGEILFEEHSASDEMYVVLRGQVDILVSPRVLGVEEGEPKVITSIGRGQVFGEIALVDQGLRTAAARVAAPETRLLVIPRDALLQLCEEDYELGYRLMRNIAAELAFKVRGTDLMVREQLRWSPSVEETGEGEG